MNAYQIFKQASEQALDTAANVLSGATLTFSLSTTDTPTDAYSDSTLATPVANPYAADSAGVWAPIFLSPFITYRIVLKSAAGAVLKTWDPANENVFSADLIGLALNPQTPAETLALVTPVNFAYTAGHAYRYTANAIPGTTNMTSALQATLDQAVQVGGADPIWPGDTLLVSSLTASGSVPIHVRTEGRATILQQKSGTAVDTSILYVLASNFELDTISVKGNISTDSSEHMHGIEIGGATAVSRVTVHGVSGTNIRGDVVYIGGLTATPVYDVKLGSIDGTNIYRNIVSFVGVNGCEVDSITGTQIGYRCFDIEPNAGSSQAPTNIRIKYIRGANILFAGDPTINNGSVLIDFAELDNSLLADSTPGYPTHPSSGGNLAINIGQTASLHFGYLKVRGYGERVVHDSASVSTKCRLVIDYFDCDTSNTTETTYKTLIEGQTLGSLEINGGKIVLQAVDRYICKDVQCTLKNLAISGGAIAASATRCVFENLQINASSLASLLFSSISNSTLRNVVFTNDGSATLFSGCSDNVVISSSGAPSSLITSGTSHAFIKSTFNSVAYDQAFLPGGILTLGASGTSPVIVNGNTISTATSVSRVSPGGAVTGIILQAGVAAGQEVTVINESAAANTVTFAVAGTSNVADGVTTVIAGLRCAKYTWSSATSRWYHS